MAYSCETEELESLREQVIALNRERAETIRALRDLFAGPTGNPAADRVDHAAAWERARNLLRSIREE